MIKFKEGVDVTGIKKETITAMVIVADCYYRYFGLSFGRDLVVTSVTDGKHKENSLHYQGLAFDIRTWTTDTSGIQMHKPTKLSLANSIADALGDDYDVVVEKTHIHIEYDPTT